MIKNTEEWMETMREASLLPDSPIEQKDGRWRIRQRLEVWKAAAPRIFDVHLERFQKVAIEVLREKDPKFELDHPEDRFMAGLRGRNFNHSQSLRNGVAETLALLGSFPRDLTSLSSGKAETTAATVVQEILQHADWILWASLNYQLPMLAEAAPNEFLNAVEKGLAPPDSPVAKLYGQERSGLAGQNYLTGVLWGLETLAWEPRYLTRVIVLLGELAAIDPGGNWANRPSESVVDILLPWHPQTCADIPKRKAALLTLISEQPAVGWKVLLSLLPSAHGVTSGTHKPMFRQFIPESWRETVTRKDYWDQVTAYSEVAVDIALKERPKLVQLIEHIATVVDPARSRLLAYLSSSEIIGLSEPERQPIWEALTKVSSKHRRFAQADWAMDADTVSKLEGVAAKLAPQSPKLKYRHLFSGRDFEFFDVEAGGDYEAQRQKLEIRRQEAVKEILSESGIQGVIEFALSVDAPAKVGAALGVVGDPAADNAMLPALLTGEQQQYFVAGFIQGRLDSGGWEWVDSLPIGSWDNPAKTSFLTKLPFGRQTWERAARLLGENAGLFWKKVYANAYQVHEDDLVAAAQLLLENGRPRAAVECLQVLVFDKKPVSPTLVSRALRESVNSEEPLSSFDQHSTQQLIEWLQSNAETDGNELFQIEWSYLPLLDRFSGVRPKTLEAKLASDPQFFCEVIRTVFRSDKDESAKADVSDDKKKIAENAYRLLDEWSTAPGTTTDENWNEDAFNKWLAQVKKSTSKSGHFRIAMSQIGQVLPYAPADPSGLWINKAVAAALNARDADPMRSGFTTELFNMRGGYGFTAGREERQIAEGYREKAEAVENVGHHRLATALRDLAHWYDRAAERDPARGPIGE
jgi:hypothetical protein